MSDLEHQSVTTPRAGKAAAGPAPVLVLEDSDEDFDTVLEAFQAGGFTGEVRRATSGDECLELLSEAFGADSAPSGRPAVVLLDLNTPGLDGRDALKIIKGDERLRTLPVVVLTTSSNPKDLELCYETGANAYHLKPVSYPQHLDVLQRVFGYWLGGVELPDGIGPGRDHA